MSWPSSTMRPLSGVSKPASMRSSVDLPEPEPPRSANISPLWMSRLTSSTASVLSKLLDTPRMLSNTSAFAEVLIPLTTPLTPGLNAGPGAGHQALCVLRPTFHDVELFHHIIRRVNAGVVKDFCINKFIGCLVGVGVPHIVGHLSDDLWLHQKVDQLVGIFNVRCASRDGHHVEPQHRALFGNGVADFVAVFGFLGTSSRLQDIAGIAGSHAQVAISQIANVAG